MHDNNYENKIDGIQLRKRLKWAVMNGINTCILTGTGECLQNSEFLHNLHDIFDSMNFPFPNTEIQTTGVMLSRKTPLDFYYEFELLNKLQVNTISLSVFDIFNNDNNLRIIGVAPHLQFNLDELCELIKTQGFNLRLSINMIDIYDKVSSEEILNRCKELGADQVTFRKLYETGDNSSQSKWVRDNQCVHAITDMREYISGANRGRGGIIKGHGKKLHKLPFGAYVYSINGMSTVIDFDCMSKDNDEDLKYVILRENGKLYSQWDDEGSLIF
jgi:hypothetical protein